MESEEVKLLKRISAQVSAVEAKIDANALAMSGLTEKLDRLEVAVELLEQDVANGKRNALIVGAISGGSAGALMVLAIDLLRAKMGL